MSRKRFLFPTLCALAFLIGFAGCDRGPEQLVPVSGKICYRGVPLPTGTVTFTPDPQRGSSGQAASADLQKDGSYRLRTGDLEGVVAGWHRITVLAVEMPVAEVPKERLLIPRSLIPEKYRDPELSKLVREVKAGKENQIDLNLE